MTRGAAAAAAKIRAAFERGLFAARSVSSARAGRERGYPTRAQIPRARSRSRSMKHAAKDGFARSREPFVVRVRPRARAMPRDGWVC